MIDLGFLVLNGVFTPADGENPHLMSTIDPCMVMFSVCCLKRMIKM